MEKKENELVTIEQVHDISDVTVWDNCPLIGYLTGDGRINDPLEFAEFFIDKIPVYNCFVPKPIVDEYVFNNNGRRRSSTKEINFIKKFQNEDRILYLNDFPLGPKVKKRAKKLQEDHGINKADWNVLAWGIELCDYFGSSAVVSNDIRGLAKLWNKLSCWGVVDKSKLGFFLRRGLDLYERFV